MVILKKVLFLITTLAHGGAERVLVNLANNLDPGKYDITIQSIFDGGINKKFILPHIHYKSIFPHTFHGIKYITSILPAELLHRLFIRGKYDFEIAFLEGPPAKIISGSRRKETKELAWIHIELLNKASFSEGFISAKDAQKSYLRFDRIVCVSYSVKKCFENISGINEDVCVLYNTNETDAIRKLADEAVESEIFTNIPTICSVAKIEESKGYDRLLQAHKKLIDEGVIHRIVLIGIGSQSDNLKQEASLMGLSDSFQLIGFQENPYKYVKNADLYVCSSRREGFSTAVTEALILGVPVVSTDCSGARELLGEHDEYGLVVENSTEGIYQGMKRMLTNSELLAYYKEKSRMRGGAFSKEKTVKAVEEMLESL